MSVPKIWVLLVGYLCILLCLTSSYFYTFGNISYSFNAAYTRKLIEDGFSVWASSSSSIEEITLDDKASWDAYFSKPFDNFHDGRGDGEGEGADLSSFLQINTSMSSNSPTPALTDLITPMMRKVITTLTTQQEQIITTQPTSDDLQIGKCRPFGVATADQPDAAFYDQASICSTIIPVGSDVFQSKIELLSTSYHQMVVAAELKPIIGLGNPQTDCDLALFTYICNLVYPACSSNTQEEDKTDQEQEQQKEDDWNGYPSFPCREEYRDGVLAQQCPKLYEFGLFTNNIPELNLPFIFGTNTTKCNHALQSSVLRYKQDNSTNPDDGSEGEGSQDGGETSGGSTPPSIQIPVLPSYQCNLPLVTVDPTTYPYERIFDGICALPAPSHLLDHDDYILRDKWFFGWGLVSNIVGIFVMISYWVLPDLRKRILINLGMSLTQIHALWTFIPFVNNIQRHGWGHGANILAKSHAEEQLQTNFNCSMSAWLSIFSLFGSVLVLNVLGGNLIRKVCFSKDPTTTNHLSAKQKLVFKYVSIFLILCIPLISCIVIAGHGQFTGNSPGMPHCYIARERNNMNNNDDLSWSIGFILPCIIIGCCYLEFLWVLIFLTYTKIKSSSKSATTEDDGTTTTTTIFKLNSSQLHLLFAMVIIPSITLGIILFRNHLEQHAESIERSTTDWVTCLMTAQDSTSAQQQCGTKPSSNISTNWMLFLNWAMATRGLIYVIAIAGSFNIFSCWIKFFCSTLGGKENQDCTKEEDNNNGDNQQQHQKKSTSISPSTTTTNNTSPVVEKEAQYWDDKSSITTTATISNSFHPVQKPIQPRKRLPPDTFHRIPSAIATIPNILDLDDDCRLSVDGEIELQYLNYQLRKQSEQQYANRMNNKSNPTLITPGGGGGDGQEQQGNGDDSDDSGNSPIPLYRIGTDNPHLVRFGTGQIENGGDELPRLSEMPSSMIF